MTNSSPTCRDGSAGRRSSTWPKSASSSRSAWQTRATCCRPSIGSARSGAVRGCRGRRTWGRSARAWTPNSTRGRPRAAAECTRARATSRSSPRCCSTAGPTTASVSSAARPFRRCGGVRYQRALPCAGSAWDRTARPSRTSSAVDTDTASSRSSTVTPYFNGGLASPSSFGHSGSGGIYFWADPERDLVGVYLSVARRNLEDEFTADWRADIFVDAVTAAVED
ncbi:MAG: serine hydrolase [Chloroflexi bacterium]|nr:serine hydrolase [Chloroflexota bacterium]